MQCIRVCRWLVSDASKWKSKGKNMSRAWLARNKWMGLTLMGVAALAAAAGAVAVRSMVRSNGASGAVTATGVGKAQLSPSDNAVRHDNKYIIVYREAPLSSYKGGIKNLPMPDRLKSRSGRISVNSAHSRDYVRYLQGRQIGYESKIRDVIGRQLRVDRRLQHALNAAIVEMGEAEAQRVRKLPEVALVEEYREYQMDTDTGPTLIGAPALWNATPTRYRGEGVVFGMLDSGINFGSPSFAAQDESGYQHVNPLGDGNYLGTCAAGGVDAGRCNAKLIGGYDFVCTARANQCGVAGIREEPGFGDTNGHGSHTASTAAGNARTAQFKGAPVHISGVAPRANIIAYDICYTNTTTGQGLCPNVSAVDAIDQAIADGIVDVINYSVGGGAQPWSEAVSLAFLNATDAGIYIATSAGNSGPAANTLGHLEPWTASTAAATHGRADFSFLLQVTGPGPVPTALRAIELNQGTGGVAFAATLPGTTPLRVSAGINSADDGCAAYPAGTFQNAVAVIRRGTCSFSIKVGNAAAAGAVATIIANNAAGAILPSVPDTTIPSFGMTQANGDAVRDFATTNGNTSTGAIGYPAAALPNTPDVLGDFSSRGPAGAFDLVKPDLTAPGVNVLAVVSGTTITGSENALDLYNGTSMASPHQAGAAGLLRQAKPTWTVPEIKSALMMTARQEVFKEDSVTPANAFDMGAGRIQVDQALRAGLVMNETIANFIAANPATGGDASSLNLPSLGKASCADSCTFTRVFRNVLTTRQSWTVKAQGVTALVSPSLISLNPGETKSVKVTISAGSLPRATWNFGKLVITPQGGNTTQPILRLPIAIRVPPAVIAVNPASVGLSLPVGGSGTVSFTVGNTGGSRLDYQIDNTGSGIRTLLDAPRGAVSSGFRSTQYTDPATAGNPGQYSADDFTMTESGAVSRLFTEGFVSSGQPLGTTTSGLTWSIYRDSGGNPEGNPQTSPGVAVWSYSALPTSPGVVVEGANITLNLAAAGQNVNLAPGRYWLIVHSRSSFANRWVWFASNTGDNIFRTITTGASGTGTWVATTGFAGLAFNAQAAFACGAPWIGNATGAIGQIAAGAANRTIQVQINAAGLAPGTRTGYVCVGSNDPARPKTAVRVTLTVAP